MVEAVLPGAFECTWYFQIQNIEIAMSESNNNPMGWLVLRALGIGSLAHVLYALVTGAIRFPGGRGGTGGSWVYWSDNPGLFLVMLAIFIGLGIAGLVYEPVGKDGRPPE